MTASRNALARRQPAQNVIEYGLIIAALVLAAVVAANVLSGSESNYFTNLLGPVLAPTPSSFDPLPATPVSGATSTPTPTVIPGGPTATPTPTATPDPGKRNSTTSLNCTPTSGTIPSSSPLQVSCTVTVTNAGGTGQTATGSVNLSSSGNGTFSACSLIGNSGTASCSSTYTTTAGGT